MEWAKSRRRWTCTNPNGACRRVFVVSTGEHEAEVAQLFAPLAEASRELLTHYNDKQLALLIDFVTRLNEANRSILGRPTPAS
jgi:hypothetical protein